MEEMTLGGQAAAHSAPTGARRAEAALFLHAAWATHHDFDDWLPVFADAGFDSYATSRGGRADMPPADVTGLTFAANLDDAMNAVQSLRGSAVVVGHSLGGLLAMKLAEAGRAAALVLLAPAPPAGVRGAPPLRGLPTFLELAPRIATGRKLLPSLQQASRVWLSSVAPGDRRRVYSGWVPDSGLALRQMFAGISVKIGSINCPVLCISGIDDRALPYRLVRRTAKRYGFTSRELPGHGHWLTQEPSWPELAIEILSWLDEQFAAAPAAGR